MKKCSSICFLYVIVSRMEASLGESDQRVCELSQALADSNEQLGQLQTLSQSQSLQIQQLQDACTQLSGVREMNEVSIWNILVAFGFFAWNVSMTHYFHEL